MTSPVPNAGFPLARVILLTLVAALLGTVLWFGSDIMALRAQVAGLETERDLARTAEELAQSQLKERTLLGEGMINDLHRQLREKIGFSHVVVTLLAPPGGTSPAQGAVLWDSQQQAGMLVASRLPTLPGDQVYRASIVLADSTEQLIDVLEPDSSGNATKYFSPSRRLAGALGFTVQAVEKNGSPKTAPKVVLSGK